MGVHIVIVLYYTARPKVEVEIRQVGSMQNHLFSYKVYFFIFFLTRTMYIYRGVTQVCGHQYVSVTPDQAIVFPSVSFIRNLVRKHWNCSSLYFSD